MRLRIEQADILDVEADVLVCSANCYLNLTGGVGGALLQRYGRTVQEDLHAYLATSGRKFLLPGGLAARPGGVTPYRLVIHAVAVDAFYLSSVERVQSLLHRAMELADEVGARTVAVTALATGFGHLTLAEFARAFATLESLRPTHVEEAVVAVNKAAQYQALMRAVALPAGH
jgi:O-acetyl-ADP-ribose deacetylase (regulator of RNase III)